MVDDYKETKICKVCGGEFQIDRFEQIKPKNGNPYYISTCKKCRYEIRKANKNELSNHVEIIEDRKYKALKHERILKLEDTGVSPINADEIFVKLMDYKNAWLSNHGRMIRWSNGGYSLLKGSYDGYGALYYTVQKNVYSNGKWIYKSTMLYAAKAVVQEFIVNPDIANNTYIWHRGYDKKDNYYKNLYPLNLEQYRIVKAHFMETKDDAEDFIIKVMNDIKFKPDNWSKKCLEPTVCGMGYHGNCYDGSHTKAYLRWSDMINRCYNKKFHERQPQYAECTVCEEWLNFSNFKVWYEEHKVDGMSLDLDKDILFKGNKVYSPETVAFVPHSINTLFVNGKKNRGDLPVGIYFDKSKGKYRAVMNVMGKNKKLGEFCTAEAAFYRYKEYKEDLIKNMANQYKEKIPYIVYEAMLNWEIEITD